jgi:hypothetical protein
VAITVTALSQERQFFTLSNNVFVGSNPTKKLISLCFQPVYHLKARKYGGLNTSQGILLTVSKVNTSK